MKRFLATTAISLCVIGPVSAQSMDGMFIDTAQPDELYGSELMGKRLYVDEAEFTDGMSATPEIRAEWDDVGEISDLLISADGQIRAAILDIGGFLGIGENRIAVDMSRLNFVADADSPDDMFVAVTGTREELETAPVFEEIEPVMPTDTTAVGGDAMDADPAVDTAAAPAITGDAAAPMASDTATTEDTAAPMASGDAVAPDAAGDTALLTPTVEREGYVAAAPEELTAERLEGAAVYGSDDSSVGSISELLLSADGQIDEVVMDVGGFLGLGAHTVAVPFDQLQVIQNEAGDVRVYVEGSKEKFEAMPAYEG